MTTNIRPITKCGNATNLLHCTEPVHVAAIRYTLDCLQATQAEVCRRLSVSRTTVRRWITGETAPTTLQLAPWPEFAIQYHYWVGQLLAERAA